MCCWVCVCMWRVYGKSHWSCSTLCLVLQHSSQNSRGSDVSFHCFIINSDNMQFFFICNIVLLFHYLIQIICYMSCNVIANICDFLRIMRNLLVPCGPVDPVSPSRPAMSWWFHINQEKGASYCCLNRPWCLETGAQFSSVGYDCFANIMPLLILHFLKLRSNTSSILH